MSNHNKEELMGPSLSLVLPSFRSVKTLHSSESMNVGFAYLDAKRALLRLAYSEGTPAIRDACDALFRASDDVLEVYLAERDSVKS